MTSTSRLTRLPQRPRLLPGIPVLHRAHGVVQVGTDPRHAVVLDGLSEELIARLRAMDGGTTDAEALRQTPAADRDTLIQVLSVLVDAGLVEDAAAGSGRSVELSARLTADATTWALRTGRPSAGIPADRADARVVVHGDGRIAIATACLLAGAGVGWVHVVARGTVEAADCGCGYRDVDLGRARSAAAARALRRVAESVRTEALPAATLPSLVVLADAAVPDPDVTGTLCAAGTAHLVARTREGNGWVGPLVIPGRTGCLRCLDLHRTDRDPCWPRLAAQLAGRQQHSDLIGAGAVAAFSAGQVLRAIDGDRDPALWNSMIEVDPFGGSARTRHWEPHPHCHCGAAAGPAAQPQPR